VPEETEVKDARLCSEALIAIIPLGAIKILFSSQICARYFPKKESSFP
jgi:hypothetical protein